MGIFNFGKKKEDPKIIGEEIKAFEKKGLYNMPLKDILARKGEGWETLAEIPGYGVRGISTFNMFYSSFINRAYETELQRIKEYRDMAAAGEVADVIEDAVNESTQGDAEGHLFHLVIKDKELEKNENIVNNIKLEFNELFRERINMKEKVWDMFWSLYIDGRVYYERVIDQRNPKKGIINIKRLPSETMDFFYDPLSGRIIGYVQYTKPKTIRPTTVEDARKRDGTDLTFFDPNQIGFIDNGIYGKSRYEIFGYLEKVKVPFNQLKMLETAVIIMRIVRAPERLVFRIDTGNMPRDKALKYVEKIKQKMSKKQTYDPRTGKLTHEPEILSILENFYLPQSSEGRGSNIETIGGNTNMFSELADVFYFQDKLYRALKYPMSRVHASQDRRDQEVNQRGGGTEISRDEIKWAKFLERNQEKLCKDFTDMFLLHLEFKGLKEQYGLSHKKIGLAMNPPSQYKEQMDQIFNDARFANYAQLADRQEMSKYYLMKRFLKWDDEEITANVEGKKRDVELGLAQKEEDGGGQY
jgi:hypothetical protein